jgi:trk system potassium uptake protein TrkH
VFLGRSTWDMLNRGAMNGRRASLPATQMFLLSFAGLILVGALGLLVLPGLYTGPRLGVVDALFTATSAVCVTGLIVVDTATYFTPLGQAWIALLIQLGGLGILTFTSLVISLLGRRASLGAEEAAAGHASVFRHLDPRTLVKAVVASTLLLEGVGAAVLWVDWSGRMGWTHALWPAVFHAVSAFCNAGFSVFSDSLVGLRRSPVTLLTVSGLIVLGGIGFVVLADFRARYRQPGTDRLSTHTRLALLTTAVLLGGSTLLFLTFEASHAMRGLGWIDKITNSWFMAVTPRTAGFNTVDYDTVSNPSLFLTIVLMIIGGSPGSTAGGLKTTTVALLVLVLWSRLKGRDHVSFMGRTIPDETLQRATGLTIGGLSILGVAVFLLSVTELPVQGFTQRAGFLRLVFEAHSAFGTVGLSMGVTSSLTEMGRLIIITLMYLGRVGPLAVASAMALAGGRHHPRYRYAREDVVIG